MKQEKSEWEKEFDERYRNEWHWLGCDCDLERTKCHVDQLIPSVKQFIADKLAEEREKTKKLFDVLDSIDTLPDMIHPTSVEDYKKLWRMVIKRIQALKKINE